MANHYTCWLFVQKHPVAANRPRATLRVTENFAKSLKVVRNYTAE